MRKKVWFLDVDLDGVNEFHGEVQTWFEGVCKILACIQKGVPFICSLDFFYRDGDDE